VQRHLVAARGADADRRDRFAAGRDGAHDEFARERRDAGDGADGLLARPAGQGIGAVLAAGGERGEGGAGGGQAGGGDEAAAAGHGGTPGGHGLDGASTRRRVGTSRGANPVAAPLRHPGRAPSRRISPTAAAGLRSLAALMKKTNTSRRAAPAAGGASGGRPPGVPPRAQVRARAAQAASSSAG